MKHLRKFSSVSAMETAMSTATIDILGLAFDEQGNPVMRIKSDDSPVPPTNLVISCSNNTVTITATNATTLEYNFDGSSTYTTYTQPFTISQTVMVYAKATNSDGSITSSQRCVYIDYSEPFYIYLPEGSTTTISAVSGLQMSTDKENWTDTTETTLLSGKTYFRVASDQESPLSPLNGGSGSGSGSGSGDDGDEYEIGGNINSLVKVNFENDTNCYVFYDVSGDTGFFQYKAKLKSASNLILPATTLTERCYASMFNGCTSLTSAPVLPATTLAYICYASMFDGCTSLTTAPELPATTLTDSCYYQMFNGCTSLTSAPELPATTLAQSCYYDMFGGCTSLTTAPVLPATTLAYSCYANMFDGCSSLATAPELPATTLADSCYTSMFQGCTSLTTAPELPATTLAEYCYQYMFNYCRALTTAPALPATTLVDTCYYGMFYSCTSLTTAPELPATTLAINCYNSMFNGCTKLNYIKCLATNISVSYCTDYWVHNVASTGTFVKNSSMSSWTTGNNGIPSGWTVQDAAE